MVEKSEDNVVRESEREGIRPEFLGGTEGGSSVPALTDDMKRGSRRSAAVNDLQNAETAASGGLYQPKDDLEGTRKAENEGGLYAGKNSKIFNKSKINGKGGSKRKRKGGPFIAIILAIFGFGGVMMGAQAFQPFSLVAQFQEKFNSMSISTTLRSARFVKWQMGDISGGNVKDPIKSNVFGGVNFKITNSQKARLAEQGIEYDSDAKVMRFTTSEIDVETGQNKVIEVDAAHFDEVYASNAEFHNAYNAGSKTWRGQFANWFGSTVINFITNNKLTRNMFADFRQRVDDSPGKSSMDVFKEIMNEKINGNSGTVGAQVSDQNDNKDGTESTESATSSEGYNSIKDDIYDDANGGKTYADSNNPVGSSSAETISTKSNLGEVSEKINKIAGKFSRGVGFACGVLQVAGVISLLVAASEAIQIINLTTAVFETVDKVKAGYGNESPIDDLADALNSKTVNVTYSLEKGDSSNMDATGLGYSYNEGESGAKTAMESAGVAALYGNGQVDANDASVSSFNLSKSINGVIGGFVTAGTSFATCAVAKMAVAAVSATSKVLCVAGAIGAIFTLGGSLLGCAGEFLKIVGSITASAIISGLVSLFIPVALKLFTRNLVSNLGGEDFGNALTSGANLYQGSAHRAAGGSLATADQYAAYLVEQQAVIADQAKYERESLSPFDMTSKYTFMGSLMTQLMAFTTSSGTLMDTVKTTSSVLTNSVVAMSPTATAYNIAEVIPTDMEEYEKTCPYLASIGAVGDAFCNPYIMTDTTTMNIEPEQVITEVQNDLKGELTSDGNVIVDEESDLAKYIVYCDNRSSSFGVADYNIANSIGNAGTVNTSSSAFNTVANAGIGTTIFGDITDIVNNANELASMGYITGESCVAGNTAGTIFSSSKVDGATVSSPSWNKAKYYQRFIEDQALAESMGLIEKSAATTYYEKYLAENPLDNSYEGVLARYSGLDKDTVSFALDVMWYADYIANYDPSERYAFSEPVVEAPEEPLNYDNEYVLAGELPAGEQIVYADVRNRNFAA